MKQTNNRTNRSRLRRWLRVLPAIAWMAVIYVLSAQTGDEISSLLPFLQQFFPSMTSFNWGHYVSYFILAMTFDYALSRRADRWHGRVLIILLCGLYGVSDEVHQSYVGGRMMDLYDIRNDMIGAAVWTIISAVPPVRRLWHRLKEL
ncbi:VanZ family protein [Paenibacillus sp. GCM10023252]|uniref:VanZ family protein n=1 Tax=Paenibacillus sp. GCM10023252 TaxID=3252649 RepID=UPI00360B7905